MDQGPLVNALSFEDLCADWSDYSPYFETFAELSGGSERIDTILVGVSQNEYQAWEVICDHKRKAVLITSIAQDLTKTCFINYISGEDHQQWTGVVLATIRVWSHSLQSKKLQVVVRAGWEKKLRAFGLKRTQIVMELLDGQGQNDEQQQGYTLDSE